MLDQIRPSDLERFWSKVNLTPTDTGCIEWKAEHATARNGYGSLRWKNNRMVGAHIIAFELAHGREPDGLVTHTCDNPPCVNAEHLVDGTHITNVIEMHDRNPRCRAEGAHSRKLSFDQVDEIRRLYRTGEWSADRLAALFGVTQTVISAAASGRSYKRGPTEPPVEHLGRARKVAG